MVLQFFRNKFHTRTGTQFPNVSIMGDEDKMLMKSVAVTFRNGSHKQYMTRLKHELEKGIFSTKTQFVIYDFEKCHLP